MWMLRLYNIDTIYTLLFDICLFNILFYQGNHFFQNNDKHNPFTCLKLTRFQRSILESLDTPGNLQHMKLTSLVATERERLSDMVNDRCK